MDPTYERFLSSSEKESVEKILIKDYAGANVQSELNIDSPKNETKIDAFLKACGNVLGHERNLSSKKRSLTIKEEISKYKAAIISNKNPICEFWIYINQTFQNRHQLRENIALSQQHLFQVNLDSVLQILFRGKSDQIYLQKI